MRGCLRSPDRLLERASQGYERSGLQPFDAVSELRKQPLVAYTDPSQGSGAISMKQIPGLLPRQPMLISGGVQKASLQQLEVRLPVHLTLDELQAIDLPFCLPTAPLVR